MSSGAERAGVRTDTGAERAGVRCATSHPSIKMAGESSNIVARAPQPRGEEEAAVQEASEAKVRGAEERQLVSTVENADAATPLAAAATVRDDQHKTCRGSHPADAGRYLFGTRDSSLGQKRGTA